MRRLILYATALVLAIVAAALSWGLAEARLAFIALGAGQVVGLYWIAQRFPEMRGWHLRTGAIATFVGALAIAIALPSTKTACDCPPPPRGAFAAFACNCPPDRHLAVRFGIVLIGAVGASVLMYLARRRRVGTVPPHAHATA
jgi:hypothetical protein